jgi:GAF domain-containing protein
MLQAAQSGELVRADEQTVAIPIQERGNILGILRLRKPEDHPWSKEELSLVETLTEQLYLALENARLYSESQRRAERERLASNIVARMRSSNDPQVILQTAVQELRQALLPHQGRSLPPAPDPAQSEPENGKSSSG